MIVSLIGCSTSSYRINGVDSGHIEFVVTPDRVIVECLFIDDYTGDLKSPYGFLIHILNDRKSVFSLGHSTVLDHSVCVSRMNEVRKLIKNGEKIYVGGIGKVGESRQQNELRYLFPGLGTFPDSGESLGFQVIWNDKGQCFDSYSGDAQPCPRNYFPLGKK